MNGGSYRVLSCLSLNATHSVYLSTVPSSANAAELNIYVGRTDGAGYGVTHEEGDPEVEGVKLFGDQREGSTRDGGLGSVRPSTFTASPDGSKCAYVDTDGRLVVVDVPSREMAVVDTWIREFYELQFSPGSRYLGFLHAARNQFAQISAIDLSSPSKPGGVVHLTSDRYNSGSFKFHGEGIYYLSDRDVNTDVGSPWGTRAPYPHLDRGRMLYRLNLGKGEGNGKGEQGGTIPELRTGEGKVEAPVSSESSANDDDDDDVSKDKDQVVTEEFNFGSNPNLDYSLARKAHVVASLPRGLYDDIVSVTGDGKSLLIMRKVLGGKRGLYKFTLSSGAISRFDVGGADNSVASCGLSSKGGHVWCLRSSDGGGAVFENAKGTLARSEVDFSGAYVSVDPSLEWRTMYGDAWRMLRDYFYDVNMHGIDWPSVYNKYLPLVDRVSTREELDDVLRMMSGELSALHVFVYGGDYGRSTLDIARVKMGAVACLGADLDRTLDGYVVVKVFEGDPEFPFMDGLPVYSPLSHRTLSMSGQVGLKAGDVIVSINNEDVRSLPSLGYALRGMRSRSVKLGVRRRTETTEGGGKTLAEEEFIIAVPIGGLECDQLKSADWEWNTREKARAMARKEGFEIGYVHLRSMSGAKAENAFIRNFFSDYDKPGFILDLRNNHGGNIDSWVLDALQRRAW